ncbi:MAG TPA: DegT/DnrJ/EryC1/StrS family aminotransferase [Patescibacteria group bacterium]|nr:DegT/DnrJ/EryC1/StrS family aminotransferase [Patescibacteria group bacterium]
MRIPLSRPDITQKDIDAVVEVLQSDILSIGPKIEEFENSIADFVGMKHAVGVNSGTSGLHLLIGAMGIERGDEVVTTPFSFVASTNCFLFEGARPVFVDIDEKTFDISAEMVEDKITDKTKLLLPVDVFGQPTNMKAIIDIGKKHGIKVLEDSCEAIGSEYDGAKAGSLADGAVFAFYPNKQITSAEGGMIVTNDDDIADTCRSLRSQGRAVTGRWLHHDRMGYNYRLSELHSALGVSQLSRMDEIMKKREQVAGFYYKHLKDIDGITPPWIHPKVTKMSWFVYTITFDERIDRNKAMDMLNDEGIDSKPYFTPIHLQPYMRRMFGFKEGDFPVTERVGNSTIALPFYTKMKETEVMQVCEALKDIVGRF